MAAWVCRNCRHVERSRCGAGGIRSRQRRRHIIAVTIDCIATHGLGGTTLERIADMAGMARGHVRHYAGNRDELLTDAARVFYFGDATMDEKDVEKAAAIGPMLDPNATMDEAMDYLFGEFAEPNSDNPAAFAFMDASRTMPSIHEIVLRAYAGMQESLSRIIRRTCEGVSDADCWRAAYSVLTIALGNVLITYLELSKERVAAAGAVAEEIIARLPDAACAGTR